MFASQRQKSAWLTHTCHSVVSEGHNKQSKLVKSKSIIFLSFLFIHGKAMHTCFSKHECFTHSFCFGKFTSFSFSKSVSDRLNTNIAFANVIYNLKSLTAFMRNKDRVFVILASLQRSSWRGYYGKAIFWGEQLVRELCCFYFVVPPSASCCFRMLLQVVSLRPLA